LSSPRLNLIAVFELCAEERGQHVRGQIARPDVYPRVLVHLSAEKSASVGSLFSKNFGAFVKLEPGVEGLVHISELSYKRVHRVSDIVKEGQQVDAKVLSVDTENQRISLSMKAYEARPESAKKEEPQEEAAAEAAAPALGVQLESLGVRGPDDFARAFQAATRRRAGALLILDDFLLARHMSQIAALMANAAALLSEAPKIEKIDLLAAKLPG
jgi:predicted RNA-binding protein with RPS1 domain